MEFGIYSFADVGKHPVTGEAICAADRMKLLLEQIKLADQCGLDVFGIGEHHRPDYAVSAPAVVLAAAAVLTKNIKLTSAVTVLSSEDPVRVFQQFSTIDLLSGGRAEIMAGRGSFIESFPLFGYDLQNYDELFSEKLEMLMRLNEAEHISWKGKHTQSIDSRGVYPRPLQQTLPIWVAVGGTPESVVRAAQFGLPMALAIIGGTPARFAGYTNLYKEVFGKAGHPADELKLSINSHTFVADDAKAARDIFYPSYAEVMSRLGRERGWGPLTREQFDSSTKREGALLVGSAQQVIEKILYQHELFGHTRFLAQMDLGAMPHKHVLRSIELLGSVVAPAVRKHLSFNDSVGS